MSQIECDVAVVGCGPTGVVLANLLGAAGVRVVVLERDTDVYPIPRATHVDEETLRNFASTGLGVSLRTHTSPFGELAVATAAGRVIWAEPVGDPHSPHGDVGSRFFDQPAFERILRDGLDRYPTVTLRLGAHVRELENRDDGVTLRTSTDGTDPPGLVHASWVVGCDGGRSVVRAALGLAIETLAPRRPWLLVDTLLRDAADAERLPPGFRYVLDRRRLLAYAHGFGRNRRWEFQLGDDEAPPSRDVVLGWIGEFIDPTRLDVLRIAAYDHVAAIATTWRVGRTFVAGDAAHMLPPSAGQGLCSGVRDAVNLAWKLAAVVRGWARADVLDTYERERRPHVREMLEGTLFIAGRLEAASATSRARRRIELELLGAVAPLRAAARARAIRRPPLRAGCLDDGAPLAGRPFPAFEVGVAGAPHRVDLLPDDRFALLVAPWSYDRIEPGLVERPGVALWRLGASFDDPSGAIAAWMSGAGLDFALVRPDRQLFSAGRVADLPRAMRRLDAWLV